LGASASWGQAYFGFDRNLYPGDEQLPLLRHTFSYTGYFLNNPPRETTNTWTGKRAILKANGFGFAILYTGRSYADLKGKDAAALGRSDGAEAIAAAAKEGFPRGAILFLDQEEGGRLLPEQSAYLLAWVQSIRSSRYRPGVYCSGIDVGGTNTASDILSHDPKVALWVANDRCPPSPGCVVPEKAPGPAWSGTAQALIWQYAQSPRRPFANACAATYAADQQCYVPGVEHSSSTYVDLNVSGSEDPSRGR
jgi:hypothetical protein